MMQSTQMHNTSSADKTQHGETGTATTVQASSSGPATYSGGAPKPSEHAASKPCNEEQRQAEQHSEKTKADERVKYAEAAHEENKAHSKGMMDKARSAAHVAATKAAASVSHAQHAVENKFSKKADQAENKWFKECFPSFHDDVQTVYQVTYVDGQAQDHVGKVAITDNGVHFADGNKAKDCKVQESAQYKMIASLRIEDDVMGKKLNVYTTDRRVLQFKNFRSHSPSHTDTTHTLREAHDWIDYCWRKVAEIPNPAANYASS